MNDAEYAVLSEWFNFLVTCPKLDFKVDQILYLRTDPEVAYERIKKRLRPEEHLIPFKYIQDLHELHEDWLVKKTKFQPLIAPVTIIDANLDLQLLQEQFKNYGQELLHKAKRSQ
jgi:deoxynucleoside kinase